MPELPDIVILREPISRQDLARLVGRHFEGMVKLVIDVERGFVAVGGEPNSDAETLLLEAGSRQEDLWGGNYYPGRGPEKCLEYTSLINIRPAQGNRGMVVQDAEKRERMRRIVFKLLGEGEPLP